MDLVVADASPINYLVQIGHIEILPILFNRVLIPFAVWRELTAGGAPEPVRIWVATPPPWLEVADCKASHADTALRELDAGEREAICLAEQVGADLVLMDERQGTAVARDKGLRVAGTLAVLAMASRRDLLDLKLAFDRLKRTNFRYRQSLLDSFLRQQEKKP